MRQFLRCVALFLGGVSLAACLAPLLALILDAVAYLLTGADVVGVWRRNPIIVVFGTALLCAGGGFGAAVFFSIAEEIKRGRFL